MHIQQLFDSEIFICANRTEASKLWKEQLQNRSQLWMEDEVSICLLMGPEELTAIINLKKEKPGYIYKEETNAKRTV